MPGCRARRSPYHWFWVFRQPATMSDGVLLDQPANKHPRRRPDSHKSRRRNRGLGRLTTVEYKLALTHQAALAA